MSPSECATKKTHVVVEHGIGEISTAGKKDKAIRLVAKCERKCLQEECYRIIAITTRTSRQRVLSLDATNLHYTRLALYSEI